MKKSRTREEKRWLDDVSSLGCVACRNAGYGYSPAEIHHIRAGNGMAQRASDFEVIPLCPRHHSAQYSTGFHAAPDSWQAEHGKEADLLAQIQREVGHLRCQRIGGWNAD